MRPLLALLLAFPACVGCQTPAPPAGPTALTLRIPDYERFVDETLTILRERDFRPDRVDRERGIIVAGPTTSAQWFEFWRGDTPGGYDTLESSLHTIRRTVTVDIEWIGDGRPAAAPRQPGPAAPGGDERYRVSVQVDKARYNTVGRQVTTASGALAIYNENLPTEEGLRRATAADAVWVPLGRDALLEGALLARIVDATPDVTVAE